MPDKQKRDARLDNLEKAVDEWADKRIARLKKEAVLLKKIMKGRTGAERLNAASVDAASALQVDELSQFLTGD